MNAGTLAFLDTRSEFVLKSWLEFLPPGACQGRKGTALEVFAYKLIWRSARLNLSTEGKESDAFRLAF